MENINAEILNCITAYASNQITEEEFEVLKNWLNENPAHELLFVEYSKLYKKSREIGFLQTVDTNKARAAILSRLDNNTQLIYPKQTTKIISLRKRTYKYIAAASIMIGLTIGFYLTSDAIIDNVQNNNSTTIATSVIPPGSSKAILTLEDGSEIELKKESHFSNKNVKVNGNEIVYEDDKAQTTTKISYNFLTIPRGGKYFIELSDHTKVWLNSESKLKFPVNFAEGATRQVELVYGEAYFEVSPSKKHKGARFKVLTNQQEVEVLGTQFNIKAYTDEPQILTTLVEGSITLNLNDKSQKLTPGQQSILNKETNKFTIKEVEIQYEVGWKKGLFAFNNKSLKEISKVLSRWYDVDILFADKSLENVEFKGQINRDQDIESILKLIKKTKFIDAYEIKNKTIILR